MHVCMLGLSGGLRVAGCLGDGEQAAGSHTAHSLHASMPMLRGTLSTRQAARCHMLLQAARASWWRRNRVHPVTEPVLAESVAALGLDSLAPEKANFPHSPAPPTAPHFLAKTMTEAWQLAGFADNRVQVGHCTQHKASCCAVKNTSLHMFEEMLRLVCEAMPRMLQGPQAACDCRTEAPAL